MNRVKRFIFGGENFRKEVIRQIRTLVVVTIGFSIAFSWRQTTFDAVQTLVQRIFNISPGVESSVLTSTFITLFGLGVIFLSAYFLKEKEGY